MNITKVEFQLLDTMLCMFARRTSWNLAPNRYARALERVRGQCREVLDLTASNPTNIGLAYRGEQILNALTHTGALRYEPEPRGLRSAREAVAAYYAERQCSVSPDDVILTTSTSEGYSFVFRLMCNPGDAVLVPTPSYPLFDFLADLQDVRLIPYELIYDHGWQIDLHSVRSAMENAGVQGSTPRAVLVVHPNNPTGSFVRQHEAAQLAQLCAENEMAIVADEVFLDYALAEGNLSKSFTCSDVHKAGATACLSFTLSGLSKISALPQMKVAWVAVSGPDALKRDALARLEVIADTYLSMNAPIQWAVPFLLAERQAIQPQLMQRVRENLAELDIQLGRQMLCHRLEVEGGWYAVVRIPVTGSDEEFAVALLEKTGVLVHPGHFYDFASDGYVVLSLITPKGDFAEGVKRMLAFVAGR